MQRQELLPLLNLSERGAISPELNEVLGERRAVFERSGLSVLKRWSVNSRRSVLLTCSGHNPATRLVSLSESEPAFPVTFGTFSRAD